MAQTTNQTANAQQNTQAQSIALNAEYHDQIVEAIKNKVTFNNGAYTVADLFDLSKEEVKRIATPLCPKSENGSIMADETEIQTPEQRLRMYAAVGIYNSMVNDELKAKHRRQLVERKADLEIRKKKIAEEKLATMSEADVLAELEAINAQL